ncbi:MAG: hypothetical protein HOV68_25015 [Streptomycetaceae bacterium]|nr:hypothetical protein [Streptomycetaceae bacterium]
MPLDPHLLAQALRTPPGQDVTESPIVRAVILPDPANAADLVPALRTPDSLEGANARRILCEFDPPAVPHIAAALAGGPAAGDAQAAMAGVEVIWALLTGEPRAVVAETLDAAAENLDVLLRDRTPLPDDMPAHIERDFRGRICDLTHLVLGQLADPTADQSVFRALDDEGRDEAIRQRRPSGGGIA